MASPPTPIPLELLAPAGNLECGLAALSSGADAIYVGAPKFGARAAANVSLSDIQHLVSVAHRYGAKVYVAFNTILYDNELSEAEALIRRLYLIGVDALIVQDMGLLTLDLPPIALHASTQCHNASVAQLQRLSALGFEQAVLARELTIEETATLHQAVPDLRLETFIHGALCVSYSGHCYLSQAFAGRSANRGACAQYCRLPYTLEDATGRKIVEGSHLLSLKDLNRSSILSQLVDTGAVSFKIEGRLKNASYVRNVTAYYHQLLEDIVAAQPERYSRSSMGRVSLSFTPDPFKSFSRGATTYQLKKGDFNEVLIRPESPKSEGEFIGVISKIEGNSLWLDRSCDLANGDGIAFYTPAGSMEGTRINHLQEKGKIVVDNPWNLKTGTRIYRNYSTQFERVINRPDSSERLLPVRLKLGVLPWGFVLDLEVDSPQSKVTTRVTFPHKMEKAMQNGEDRLRDALAKLGGSGFFSTTIEIDTKGFFVPLSVASSLKRLGVEALDRALRLHYSAHPIYRPSYTRIPQSVGTGNMIGFDYNVANCAAKKAYQSWGAQQIVPAYEVTPTKDAPLMTCRHCIRRHLGYCTRSKREMPYKEPLYLVHGKERIRLAFDCKECSMKLYSAQ
ncbi:U32 family peptidase [uncultured Porphyromonas sp.]|uniref:peptidase U32 family protein n=1 Tax=uncultured Porphyromonas sp. TaxID=159274 RepID=UPI00262C2ED7|nr:U32 family peptidase [uncultured Porphyromonas sp.]